MSVDLANWPEWSAWWAALSFVVRALVAASLWAGTGVVVMVALLFWPRRVARMRDDLRHGALASAFIGVLAGLALFASTLLLALALGPFAFLLGAAAATYGAGLGLSAVAEHAGALLPLPRVLRVRGLRVVFGHALLSAVATVPWMLGSWWSLLALVPTSIVAATALGVAVRTRNGVVADGSESA